jgi:hypothetical protein
VAACIKYNVENYCLDCERSDRIREYAGPFLTRWVPLADPEGNEFDLEISVGELGAGGP